MDNECSLSTLTLDFLITMLTLYKYVGIVCGNVLGCLFCGKGVLLYKKDKPLTRKYGMI